MEINMCFVVCLNRKLNRMQQNLLPLNPRKSAYGSFAAWLHENKEQLPNVDFKSAFKQPGKYKLKMFTVT